MSLPIYPYLTLISDRIRLIRADVPKLTELGERIAEHLLRGGGLFTPQIGTFWPSEFGGRAGGLMGLRPSDYLAQSSDDVAFTTLPEARTWKPNEDPRWRRLIESKARIFIIGSEADLADAAPVDRFAGFTGPSQQGEGPHGWGPVARPFEQLARGWLTAGEMVAACTRGGKMPILWMSVWLEGAMVRNASFFKHHNVREPWYPPLFHETIYIPPIAPGAVAGEFLNELERLFGIIAAQSEKLAHAGRWMATAAKAGKRISTVLVGHSYPEILGAEARKDEVGRVKDEDEIQNSEFRIQNSDVSVHRSAFSVSPPAIEWMPSISDLSNAHPADLGEGDIALHLGYSPVDVPDVQRILDRCVKFIYTSPYGRPANLKDHPNLIWLDLPWRPGDATVDIPGYSVRLLPSSSSVHTILYFALLSEMERSIPNR